MRVWVPGCSTGEEAYSIAILAAGAAGRRSSATCQLQVFATDIDAEAIEQARAGVYPRQHRRRRLAGAAGALLRRRRRMAARTASHKSIRDMLVFAEQDVIKDPPFSKLDLISCRNLLIYMDGELQQKLIPLFHYALNPGGFLFLGTSETVGDFADLFAAVDSKWKLYQRRDGGSAAHAAAGADSAADGS